MPGDLRDPGRQLDRLLPLAARRPLAVPPLEHVAEPAAHALVEPNPRRRAHRDLAVRARVAVGDPLGPRRRHPGRAQPRERARVRGQVRQVAEQHLGRAAEVGPHRRALHGDLVATEQRRGLVRVGGAADVLEESGVVDGTGVGRADLLGEPRGDQARARRLARLEPHADVRDQRQADEELGKAQALRNLRAGPAGHMRSISYPQLQVTSREAGTRRDCTG
jgi:hypothetical protein